VKTDQELIQEFLQNKNVTILPDGPIIDYTRFGQYEEYGEVEDREIPPVELIIEVVEEEIED